MFVVAVWSRAAHGPPEEAVLVHAATAGKNNFSLQDSILGMHVKV